MQTRGGGFANWFTPSPFSAVAPIPRLADNAKRRCYNEFMQQEFITRLPEWLQSMVDDTEARVGFPVDVAVDPQRARHRPGEPDALACELTHASARSLLPHQDHFPAGSVLHELLHIRRCLVDGVPRVVDCQSCEHWSPPVAMAMAHYDNALEHLVIVPHELARVPERRAYWEAKLRNVWPALALIRHREREKRLMALANWVFLQQVLPDSACVGMARTVLAMLDIEAAAEAMHAEIAATLARKEDAARVWLNHMGVPLELAALEYTDTAHARTREVPLLH